MINQYSIKWWLTELEINDVWYNHVIFNNCIEDIIRNYKYSIHEGKTNKIVKSKNSITIHIYHNGKDLLKYL